MRADGHRTAAAAEGEEAMLLAARDARPDVVIVDYDLPGGLTGLQVMARLREMLGQDLPALVLTGDISAKTLGRSPGRATSSAANRFQLARGQG